MLAGVAERMENLGGSAEKGLKVLPVTPVTSSKVLLNVELKIGSGVPLIVTSLLGKMFLMVEGDTLCVCRPNPFPLMELNSKFC